MKEDAEVEFTAFAWHSGHSYARDSEGRVWVQTGPEEWETVPIKDKPIRHIRHALNSGELYEFLRQRNARGRN